MYQEAAEQDTAVVAPYTESHWGGTIIKAQTKISFSACHFLRTTLQILLKKKTSIDFVENNYHNKVTLYNFWIAVLSQIQHSKIQMLETLRSDNICREKMFQVE